MASKSAKELERDIARVGERAHLEMKRMRGELGQLHVTFDAGIRDVTRSRALVGVIFAAAAAAGVWAGLRRRERVQRAAAGSAKRGFRR